MSSTPNNNDNINDNNIEFCQFIKHQRESVAYNMYTRRKSDGMFYDDLSQKIGIPVPRLLAYELNRFMFDIDEMCKICLGLEITFADLTKLVDEDVLNEHFEKLL